MASSSEFTGSGESFSVSISSLNDFPSELILEILHHLLPVRGFHTDDEAEEGRRRENKIRCRGLHSFTIANRRLHTIASPLLYKTFILPRPVSIAPHQLLRTFFNVPVSRRALEYIEIFDVDQSTPFPEASQIDDPGYPTLSDVESLVEQEAWRRPDWDANEIAKSAWFHQLRKTYGKSVLTSIALLTAFASNLLDFAITEFGTSRTGMLRMSTNYLSNTLGFKMFPGSRGALRNLWVKQSLRFRDGFTRFFFTDDIATMPLPVSDCLWFGHIREVDEVTSVLHPRKSIMNNSPTTEIIFESCEITCHEIEMVLLAHTNLKRFTCRWGIPSPGWRHPGADILLEPLQRALSVHRDTLEHLVLDTLESGWLVPMNQTIPPIGTLRHFTALKYIDVSGLVLFGDSDEGHGEESLAGLLPSRLETLVIQTEWDDDVLESLMILARDCSNLLPNLRIVDCSWRPASASAEMDILLQQFDIAGVQLRIDNSELNF